MIRVLFLYPRRLDTGNAVGGVAEFLFSLSVELQSMDIEPIIYMGDKSLHKLMGPIQLPGHITAYRGPFIKPGFFVSRRQLSPVLQLCEKRHVDVLHAQGTYTAGFMAWQIHKRLHIPYVVTSHNDILLTNTRRMGRERVKRRCQRVLEHATAVTHLTPIMEKASHQLWDTRQKSTTIGNGINCRDWSDYTVLPEKNYMLAIGRLEPGKGFHVLIDMYARLLQRGNTTVSLVIAGKGSAEVALQEQARELGLNVLTDFTELDRVPPKSVVFTGYVRGEAKKCLIAQSQCVLFATQPDAWEEAFSIVQLEAMAAGRPIIASDTQATQYLHALGMQVNMVEPTNIEAWTEQAATMLKDKDARSLLGKANLLAAKQFDWQGVAKQYSQVYQSCRQMR